MGKPKTPSDDALRRRLKNYKTINAGLRDLPEAAVRRLLELELAGARRPYVALRLQQRIARLERERDQRQLMGKLAAEGGR